MYAANVNDIAALKLYTRVARLGSFSAAARESGVSQSQASRAIADLEKELGARLLSRTTRAVIPTDAGTEFLARIEPILDALEEAQLSVREDGALRGVLRVGMPASFGVRVVMPRMAPFVAQHPALRVEITLEDRLQDMVKEAVDVGIRVGGTPDASGTTKRLGKLHRSIVASPAYLAEAGTPKSPTDLTRHRIVGGPASAHPSAWTFERGGKTVVVPAVPHVAVNDTVGAVVAAASGLGIASTTSWACQAEVDSGALVQLLPGWKLAELSVYAYFPAGRATRRAARSFVDFLAAALR